MANEVFIDWLTITQHHPEGGLPLLFNGLQVWYDREGNARHERTSPSRLVGSFDSALQLRCDGAFVSLSGNVGRFGREDNLFNHGWSGTLAAANRVVVSLGLPPFSSGCTGSDGTVTSGAKISRLDITSNFSTGNEGQARALIRWLGGRSIARMRKGQAADESVWWANTRHMVKAYIKHIELARHGKSEDEFVYQWCQSRGVVRVEIELKRRLLQELGLDRIDSITDQKIISIFHEQTELFRAVDRSDEPDILEGIPIRSRVFASAWLAGQDVRTLVSRATLFRHAKVLRDYGIDIFQPRNVSNFPVKVRIIDMQPLSMPDWYSLKQANEK